ncbi:hypothetical protein [Deinococcus sp. QL22]|uniref:hypothetical protein n=1 Tax=Deinococcus sp. QL22 TaxID=2939437 RepID=UPI002016EAB8|nr:hypothetical protein [Deinococcus sp. QL22]UQN08623.1 hypothetical protein M1R55_21075 [Deinococcus sp. QL22]
MSNALKRHLKLLALRVIPEMERKAIEWYLKTGGKIVGKAKDGQALDATMAAYKLATSSIPV